MKEAGIRPSASAMARSGRLGVITLGFGKDKYLQQAETLARSLKLHMPDLPVAIVTDRAELGWPFDITVPIKAERGLGVVQKIWLDDYSPFEETLFIDSDCIAVRPFHDQLEALRGWDFTPTCDRYLGLEDDDPFYFEDFAGAMHTLGLSTFPKFNGGLLFFRRGETAARVFKASRALALRQEELGLKSFDRGGVADETVMGLALAQEGLTDLYDCHGTLMRTPIGLSGALTVDALRGDCRFVKNGEPVSPAICHFAAPYAGYSEYRYNSSLVRHPGLPGWLKPPLRHYCRAMTRLSGAYR